MKNSILSLITRIYILLMIVVSCKKDNNEPDIIDLNVQRIAEVLYTNNGIEEYKDQPETKVLREYTATISQNTMKNHKVHEEKADLIRWAFVFMVLAIGLFFVFAIINWLI